MTPISAAEEVLLLGDQVSDLGSGLLLAGELAGRPVLVRRLAVDGDAGSRAHATLLARELLGIEHPNLLPVIDVRTDWAGIDLVYDTPGAAAALPRLLGRRTLRPAEVVGLGLVVGDALRCLHNAGLTHGRLTAADLLVGSDGSVLVSGYGVAGVLGSAGSASADVRDLLDLLLACLGDAGGAAAGELRALGDAPELDARRLIGTLGRLPSAPVGSPRRPVEPVLQRRPPRHRVRALRGLRRAAMPQVGWRVLGAALPAALGVLLLAGWLGASLPDAAGEAMTGRPDVSGTPSAVPTVPAPTKAAPTVAAPTVTAPTDWRAVMIALNDARTELLEAPDERRLASVDAPGSSAYATDLALIRDLGRVGAAARGFRTDLVSVEVRAAGPTRTDLTVVDVLRPYTIVRTSGSAAGQVLQQRLGRPARTTSVALVRVTGQWRVAEVRAG